MKQSTFGMKMKYRGFEITAEKFGLSIDLDGDIVVVEFIDQVKAVIDSYLDTCQDFTDALDEWRKENDSFSTEGERGLAALNRICSAIGYDEHNYKYGSPIERFLCDNSGAIESIIDFIGEWGDKTEWKDKIVDQLKIQGCDDVCSESEES